MLEEHFRDIINSTGDAIISVDSQQVIVSFNRGASLIFGYEQDEALGQPLSILLPEQLRHNHQHQVEEFGEGTQKSRLMGERSEVFGLRKNNEQFPAEASISKTTIEGETIFTVILRDITRRKDIEEQMRSSIEEKEVLLREIHHRVKNNLQIISSLLNLQSRRTTDDKALAAINESQNRVKSIALIHEMLYRSSELARVDFGNYLNELIGVLLRSYGSHGSVSTNIETNSIQLPVDIAIPCGLIVNELISNSIKHAFSTSKTGEIWVELAEADEHFKLSVRDNGDGLSADLDILNTGTLGLRLVVNLANQLRGNIEVGNRDGAEVLITFPVKEV